MKKACEPSLLLCLLVICTGLSHLPSAFCTGLEDFGPSGDVFILVTDPRMQYDPPLDASTAVWSQFQAANGSITGMMTSDPQASVSLTFQGTAIKYYIHTDSSFPSLLITLDSTQVIQPDNSGYGQNGKKIAWVPIDGSEVDSLANHTVMIQKASNTSTDSSWNILGFSFAPPPPVASPLANTSLAASATAQSSPSQDAAMSGAVRESKRVSGGAVAGIVIGILLAVGVAGFLVCFYCRRRRTAAVVPEPLAIPPTESQRDRSQFRRLYSTLPHFTAPPSIWPTSEVRTSTVERPTIPVTREALHERVAPAVLPAIPPRIITPSPPQQLKQRQPRFSRFFVANPSSHSSRSERSRSFSEKRAPERDACLDMLAPDEPIREAENADVEGINDQLEVKRLDKGKQRAIGFEIDPTPSSRPKMTRKQSLRRFFFTTNPSPSTSSSSSTSSKKARSARKTAVAEYVRDQIRRKPRARALPDPPNLHQPMTSQTPLSLAFIPEQRISTSLSQPIQQNVAPLQTARNSRNSQTRFFTTNPNPSTHDVSNENAETDSVLSDIPPPRKDKGKGRAF